MSKLRSLAESDAEKSLSPSNACKNVASSCGLYGGPAFLGQPKSGGRGFICGTWQCQCPGTSWSWSRSAEEGLWRSSAGLECFRTGSGWHGESHPDRRTRCPPGKHTHTLSHKRYPTWTIFLLLSPSMLFCLLPLPDSLLRMWSGLVGLIWHNVLYTEGRGLQQPWKMWLATAGLHREKTFQCFPLWKTPKAPGQIIVTIIKS